MKKTRLKNIFLFLFIFIINIFLFGKLLYAGSWRPPRPKVKVKAIIDNIDSNDFKVDFEVKRVKRFSMIHNNCYAPRLTDKKNLTLYNREEQEIIFDSYNSSNKKDDNILIISPNNKTDRHLSISEIKMVKNSEKYTYDGHGHAKRKCVPFNWIHIKNPYKVAEIEIHLRYNSDITDECTENKPNVSYSKKIDYLGDGSAYGVVNEDTLACGKNDYRLYMDLKNEDTSDDKGKDIIFLLDVSGSMNDTINITNSSGKTEKSQLYKEMNKVVMSSTDSLLSNNKNRIAVIKFGTNAELLQDFTNNTEQVKSVVKNLKPNTNSGGGTNYCGSFIKSKEILDNLKSSNPEENDRKKVIFFLTDGKPTAAKDWANASGYEDESDVAIIYAAMAAEYFGENSDIDYFYSIYMNKNNKGASILQTITQKIKVNVEKYTVMAGDEDGTQINSAMNRFIARVSPTLYGVKLNDELSDYARYADEPKLVSYDPRNNKKELINGQDYEISVNNAKNIELSILGSVPPGHRYEFSFNIKPDNAAYSYVEDPINAGKDGPDIGDDDTDYDMSNRTSSGKEGFHDSLSDKSYFNYTYNGGSDTKYYQKPVLQVHKEDIEIPVPKTVKIKKELKGRKLRAAEFGFLICDRDGNIIAETVNDEEGNVVFDTIKRSVPSISDCCIKEKIPENVNFDEERIEYDNTVHWVQIVTERINGNLKITDIRSNEEEIVFVNKYIPKPIYVDIKAKKEFENHNLEAGMFKFTLKNEMLESPVNDKGVAVPDAFNDAMGEIVFPKVRFAQEGDYEYSIKELVYNHIPYVQYDLLNHLVNIKIIADEDGVLHCSDISKPVFVNIYKEPEINYDLKLKKVLKGMQLKAGRFKFVLKDDLGTVIKTVGNEENGDILFSDLKLKKNKSYQFTVNEVIPDDVETLDGNMVYDDKLITVDIDIAEDGTASVNFSDGEGIFYNRYKTRGKIS